MKKLTDKEFYSAIRKGLGRAVLYIRENGDSDVEALIENAVLHNLVYDPQTEGSRAKWLYQIIQKTERPEYYETYLLKKINRIDEFWDMHQAFWLLYHSAKNGNDETRKRLYEEFDKQNFAETWMGGEQIIALDGIKGFLHVIERIGKRMNEDPEFYEDDYLLYNTEEKLGIEKVRRAIESRLSESENIRTWNEKLYRYISASAPAKSNPAPDKQNEITLQEIKTRIKNAESNIPAIYTVFGKNTSDENITELFNMLKTEKRPEQLVRLFWIFRKRKLPEIDEQLISLTENSNSQLAKAAVSALANLSDERLRIRGLELQNQREWTKAAMGISLLIRNYKSGDNDSVEKLLTRIPDNADIDELHFAVNECLKTAENNPGKEMLNILLYIYENSPCMQCREKAVKLMIENKMLPAEYRNEGCYDACLEIRDIFNTD